jgi:hypothetical protein
MKLKDPKDWKVAGKPVARFDILNMITGQQVCFGATPPIIVHHRYTTCRRRTTCAP